MKNAVMAAGLSLSSIAFGSTWEIDGAHASAHFSVTHLMVSTVHGTMGDVSGKLELDDKDLWLPPSKQALVDELVEAVEARASVVLTGEPGVGKTCVLRALRHALRVAQPLDGAQRLQQRRQRLLKSMAYRKQWATLFASQHRNCQRCGEAITEATGWHDHHLVPRGKGGSDALANRVLLHPVCHNQLHALGLTVAKPASE